MYLMFEEERKKEKRRQIIKEVVIFLGISIIIVLIAWFIVKFALKKANVIGSSMETTLYNGEDVIINKTAYVFFPPARGAVIAFYPEDNKNITAYDDSEILIKRVIGLPGESIQVKNDGIYINDNKIEEQYNFGQIATIGSAAEKITLKDNEYFVLNDKRKDPEDSRSSSFTKVYKEKIIGQVLFSLNPFYIVGGPREE